MASEHTWVHPMVATRIAQEISAEFAVSVSKWVEEWKSYSPANAEAYMKALNEIKPSEDRQAKIDIRQRLANQLQGQSEVECRSGLIDVLTTDELIEIKHISKWKHALGQVLAYNIDHKKAPRIHLFYERPEELADLPLITEVCDQFNIKVTTESIA
jgi:hypothetical protein